MEAVLPVEIEMESLRVTLEQQISEAEWVQSRLGQLSLLDESNPAFLAIMRFPLKKARLVFFLFKTKKPFLENGLESPLIFVFILKGKTK